jgi:hypothetical protein
MMKCPSICYSARTATICCMPDSQDVLDHPEEPVAMPAPARVTSAWMAPLALLVAVVAVVLALSSIISSSSSSKSDASLGTDGSDPKARVCAAFDTVSRAIPLQTNNNLGANPVAEAAVAANARLALLGGGAFLENSLGSDAPSNLAGPVRDFAINLQDIGMNALAGIPMNDATQTTLAAQGEQARSQITDMCKK